MIVPADFFEAIELTVKIDENLLIESTFSFPESDRGEVVITLPAEMAEKYMMMLMSTLAKRKDIKQAPVD